MAVIEPSSDDPLAIARAAHDRALEEILRLEAEVEGLRTAAAMYRERCDERGAEVERLREAMGEALDENDRWRGAPFQAGRKRARAEGLLPRA